MMLFIKSSCHESPEIFGLKQYLNFIQIYIKLNTNLISRLQTREILQSTTQIQNNPVLKPNISSKAVNIFKTRLKKALIQRALSTKYQQFDFGAQLAKQVKVDQINQMTSQLFQLQSKQSKQPKSGVETKSSIHLAKEPDNPIDAANSYLLDQQQTNPYQIAVSSPYQQQNMIQLPVAPSSNITDPYAASLEISGTISRDPMPTTFQAPLQTVQMSANTQITEQKAVRDPAMTPSEIQASQPRRGPGNTISLDVSAAGNYMKKMEKVMSGVAVADNFMSPYQSLKQATNQASASQDAQNQRLTARVIDLTKSNGTDGSSLVFPAIQIEKIQNAANSKIQSDLIARHPQKIMNKAPSNSLGPALNRVPRQNKSAPSQNNMNSVGATSGLHSHYYSRGGGAASIGAQATGGPSSVANHYTQYMIHNLVTNSNPGARQIHHPIHPSKDRRNTNRLSQASQNTTLEQNYKYQQQSGQVLLNASTKLPNQVQQHSSHIGPPNAPTYETVLLASSLEESIESQQISKMQASHIDFRTAMKQTNTLAPHLLEESHNSNTEFELPTKGEASAVATNQHGQIFREDVQVQVAGRALVPAGLSTKQSQKSQQSSRRRVNIQECQQMVEIMKSEAPLDQSLPMQQKQQQNVTLDQSDHTGFSRRQSNDHQQMLDSHFQNPTVHDPSRLSLPPIGTSPSVRKELNNSGLADGRRRGGGFADLQVQGPNSTRVAQPRASYLLEAERSKGSKVVKGRGQRMSSNHTQLIHKNKPLAALDQHGTTRRSEGIFNATIESNNSIADPRRRRGQAHSINRSSNEKIAAGRYDAACHMPSNYEGPIIIKSAHFNSNGVTKPYKRAAAQALANAPFNNNHDQHDAERIVQGCILGSSLTDNERQTAQMNRTQLAVVGKHQQFTPQKPKMRKTFNKEGQKTTMRAFKPVTVQNIPDKAQNFDSSKEANKAQKKRRQTNKQNVTAQSTNSSKEDCAIGYGPSQSLNQVVAINDHASSANSSNELVQNDKAGHKSVKKQFVRKQHRVQAISEKGQRRSDAQVQAMDHVGSSQEEEKENSAELMTHLSPQANQTQISENFSDKKAAQQSSVQHNSGAKQIQVSMRHQREKLLQKNKKDREHAAQAFQYAKKNSDFDSPDKLTYQKDREREAQAVKLFVSPQSAGEDTANEAKRIHSFSISNMPPKMQTEIKAQDTPEGQHPDLYPLNNENHRENAPLAVPANSLVKESNFGKNKMHSSPLVMRMSSNQSSGGGEPSRPRLNLNLLQVTQQQPIQDTYDTAKSDSVQPLDLASEEASEQLLLTVKASDQLKSKDEQFKLADEQENDCALVTVSKIPHTPARQNLETPSASQMNMVIEQDAERNPEKQIPTTRSDCRSLDSQQKSSRMASAQMMINSSQTQLDTIPKMGDITNMTRQLSVAQVQIDMAGDLSFRQFKNPNRKRNHSVEKSSNEEVIRSEIDSDVHLDNSDEIAASYLDMKRTSGRDFSCIFDADSEGPKQDQRVIQIDKARQIELMTVKRGQKLGAGSFGEVYQGLYDGAQSQYSGSLGDSDENSLPPQMAIKVVRVQGDRLQTKLEAELELLRTLKHKHIVQYYGCVVDKAKREASIFMELMPDSLQTKYRKFGPLHENNIKRHTKQILEALCYLHNIEPRIVHGDLKAANILSDGKITKLTDFGDSRKMEAIPQGLRASAESGAVLTELTGSILWMAPECLNSQPVGRRSDIWSLGCTLIELATANHPWLGVTNMYDLIQKLQLQAIPSIPNTLSPEAKDFIRKCLNYNKDERPTALQLLAHPFVCNEGTSQQQHQTLSQQTSQ